MPLILTPSVVLYALSAAVSAVVVVVAWRRRSVPGGKALALMMLAVTQWAGVAALELAATSLRAKIVLSVVAYLGTLTAPVLYVIFAVQYSHLDHWLTRRNVALAFAMPAAGLVLAATNSWHHLVWPTFTPGPPGSNLVLYGHGVGWYLGVAAYPYACLVVGTWLLVRAAMRFPRSYRGQAICLIAGAAVPWIGNFLYATRLGVPGLDLGPVGLTFSGLLFAYALLRLRLLDLVPVARDALVETMPEGLVLLDAEGRVVDLNPAARRLCGVAPGSGLGRPGAELLGERLTAGAVAVAQGVFETTVGEVTLEVTVSPVNDSVGRARGTLLVLRDTTARRLTDEQHHALERRLAQGQRMESLGVLAGGLAHHFNNLLAVILGNLELAQAELPPCSQAHRLLSEAIGASSRGASLTRQMVAYAGQSAFGVRPLALNEVVTAAVERLRAGLPEGFELTLERGDDLPPVEGEAGRIEHILDNLVANAVDSMAARPGLIRVTTGAADYPAEALTEAVGFDSPEGGRFVTLAVTDRGPGMTPEVLSRAFDPFFTTKFNGQGLGLPAVLGIARYSGGGVLITTQPGRGTTVQVLLRPHE